MINYFLASFVFIATVIGVGIFALPYVLLKSGIYFYIFWSIFWILALSILYVIYIELIKKTEGRVNFPGILAKFISPSAHYFGWLLDILTYGSVLYLYILVISEFLPKLFNVLSDQVLNKYLFALLSLIAVILNLKSFSWLESILTIFMISFIIYSSIYMLNVRVAIPNFSSNLFFSFGPLLFAFSGISAVPIIYDILRKKEKIFLLLLISFSLIAFLYFIFAYQMANSFGDLLDEMVLRNLERYLPSIIFKLFVIFLTINIFTTFISMLYYLKRGLEDEFHFKPVFSLISLTFFLLFLINLPKFSFLKVIDFVGSLTLSLESLLLIFIYLKSSKINVGLKLLIILIGVFILAGFLHGLLS